MKASKKLFYIISIGVSVYYILHNIGVYFNFFPVNLRYPMEILRKYDIDTLVMAILFYGGLGYAIGLLYEKIKKRQIKIEWSEEIGEEEINEYIRSRKI